MKTTVAVTALLASIAFAQPYHGRHLHKKDLHKRKLVTVTTTCIETATLLIGQDGTTLIEPTPAQFYPSTTSDETTSTTSTSTSSTSTPMSKPTTLSTSTTPTSTYVQPQPTTPTTQAQETTPTTTPEAPAYTQTTSEAAAPTSGSGSGSSGGSSSYSGDLTYYSPDGYGACGADLSGMTPSGSSMSNPAVVAVAIDRFTSANPNDDPICGKIVKITANGQTGYGMIRDKCHDCKYNDLDLNPEAFSGFTALSTGRQGATWEFV